MIPEKLQLTVVTPHGHLLFSGTDAKTRTPSIPVDEVTATGILGEFGVLPGHLPFLTYLKAGPLFFRQGQETRWIAVRGGLAEVGPDKVIVLADAAELAEEIDIERAKSALAKAAKRIESGGMLEDPDYKKALEKQERAAMRLQVAERARKKLCVIAVAPIGFVRNTRRDLSDDDWGGVVSEIDLDARIPEESLHGLADFSHAEVLFHLHRVDEGEVLYGSRHPRDNLDWPKVGIFAQRGKARPNRIGLATVRIVACAGRVLTVRDLDAIDGTPVLDIKPVIREFLPRGEVKQPPWAGELMREYWEKS